MNVVEQPAVFNADIIVIIIILMVWLVYRDHKYWSESKKEYRDFLDMDIIHVFRVAIKHGMSREPSYTEYKKGIYTLTVK